LPELNRTALANAAAVSENLHDIFAFMFLRYHANARKQSLHFQNISRKTRRLRCAAYFTGNFIGIHVILSILIKLTNLLLKFKKISISILTNYEVWYNTIEGLDTTVFIPAFLWNTVHTVIPDPNSLRAANGICSIPCYVAYLK